MEEEIVSIDEWLDSHRGDGTFCLPNKLTIYFPVATEQAEEVFAHLRAEINDMFGGSTVWDGEGSWADPSCPEETEHVCIEPVKIIEVAHNCTSPETRDRLARVLKEAAMATNQVTVGVSGTNSFYIIPTGQI